MISDYSSAIEPKDHVILARVEIDTKNGLKAIISWNIDSNAKDYTVKRKLLTEDSWELTLAKLDSTATTFTDSAIERGVGYEYYLLKNCSFPTDTIPYTYEGYSYLYVGSQLSVPDYRGKLLLLVDNTISDSLGFEILRFIYDITGDGWEVIRREVPRTETFDGKAVSLIKKIIIEEYQNAKGELKSLILLGRIAVPYSGDYAVDGHEEHKGAWVADTYYSDIDGEWTDEEVNDTLAQRQENKNVPGDGKFDHNQIPSDVELQTGRIDFYNLNFYGKTDIELIRSYLNKNHDYRHGRILPANVGAIQDNFGMYGEVFASNPWMEFSGLLKPENVKAENFMILKNTSARMWAYGCGPGRYWSVDRTAYLDQLDTMNSGGIFSILFGSYNGDWDYEDNILRSVLAYSPFALTCVWSGRPFWHFHHMGMGEPIGYSTKVSQNNQILYLSNAKYGHRFVHVSLLGDPTLRMHIVAPATDLTNSIEVSFSHSKVYLNWQSSDENLLGFNLYRSNDISNKFEKVNKDLILAKEFADSNPLPGKNIYMLRAVRQTETATGTLVNMSQGIFTEMEIPVLNYQSKLSEKLNCYPNPAESFTNISYVVAKNERVEVTIWDLEGKFVKSLNNSVLSPGYYLQNWDLRTETGEKVQSGFYFIEFKTKNKSIVAKLNVIR